MNKDEIETNRARFVRLLSETGRAGVERVVAGLDELGFFRSPASTRFHGSEPGGLLAHSLNVLEQALALRQVEVAMRPALAARLPVASVTIAALLHDVCKAGTYRLVEKFRKDANGRWEKYLGYEADYSSLPIGHGEKSVVRLLRFGLELTDDEIVAIRWHMQAFDLSDSTEAKASFNTAGERCPLLAVLVAADLLATRLLEGKLPESGDA